MLEPIEEDSKVCADATIMRGITFGLLPVLSKIMDCQISSLILNSNKDIHFALHRSILEYKSAPTLDKLVINASQCIPKVCSKWKRNSIIRRAALGTFWKRFVRKCLNGTASSTNPGVSLQYACEPMGFNSFRWPCKSPFCPNCYMRSANNTRKRLITLVGKQEIKAFVIAIDTPLLDRSFGFDMPDVGAAITDKVYRTLKGRFYIGLKTIGAKVDNRAPSFSTRIAVIANKLDYDTVKCRLSRLRKRLAKEHPAKCIKLIEPASVDETCIAMYDCCPICLAGVTDGYIDSSGLSHVVEDYKEATKHKHRVTIFGPGVL